MSETVPDDAKRSGEARGAAATIDFLNYLPESCRVPGYWETLASNSNSWAHEVTASPFWRAVKDDLEKWRREYRRISNEALIKESELPPFIGKSEARIREKLLGKLEKSDSPEEEAHRLYYQAAPVPMLEDLVRVRIETKFLDGVPFLANKILALARADDPEAMLEPKGKLSGYFAQHVTFKLPVYFRFAGVRQACTVTCEIQIATTLATLVWENSHGLYERARTSDERSEDWQWSPNDPRFMARQLGHMIHLADGLFCNLRDHGKSRSNR